MSAVIEDASCKENTEYELSQEDPVVVNII